MRSSRERGPGVRERAEAALAGRKPPEEAYLKERRRIEQQNREKTERLRAMRLAKEAANALARAQDSPGPRTRKAK